MRTFHSPLWNTQRKRSELTKIVWMVDEIVCWSKSALAGVDSGLLLPYDHTPSVLDYKL